MVGGDVDVVSASVLLMQIQVFKKIRDFY